MPRVLSLIAALVLSPAGSDLVAQRLDTWPRFEPAAPFDQAPDRVRVGDYHVEGFAIGAVVGGVVGVIAAESQCGNSAPGTVSCEPHTGTSFLIGAGIGFFLGYVVGTLIPKYGPADPP